MRIDLYVNRLVCQTTGFQEDISDAYFVGRTVPLKSCVHVYLLDIITWDML